MSFQEQERALFDLLFNKTLRENFCRTGITALADYALDPTEQDDFTGIRPDALLLDADMRCYLILTHICRTYPLSFSLLSSFTGGAELLRGLVDVQTMRMPPIERASTFGARLREQLADFTFSSDAEKNLCMAILEVELGMAWTSAGLKRELLTGQARPDSQHPPLKKDWDGRAVKLAAYVSAAIIPRPYGELKNELCPCAEAELWRHLRRHPLSSARRNRALQKEEPRLLMARAYISKHSDCEPAVDHKTAELSQGFAHLFQYVNGAYSVAEILRQLQAAGAKESMLQSVRAGFQQLLETGMLELVSA